MFKKNRSFSNIIPVLLIIVFTITLIISILFILRWYIDSRQTKNNLNNLEKTPITEVNDNGNTEIIKSNDDKSNPYWKYIKMKLIEVKFDELKKINKDTKGWIQVNNTNINYPFVQGKDNDYYLTHSFDKSINDAGWVFLDYRNKLSNLDKNTILYAHGRYDQTMFGSLKNILTSGWLNNDDNYVIKMSTEYENTLWQVFSVYKIPTTSDYLQIKFYNDKEFKKFTKKLIKRSKYNFKTSVEKNDRIITLSTCYNNSVKVVLHAKLIKKEAR